MNDSPPTVIAKMRASLCLSEGALLNLTGFSLALGNKQAPSTLSLLRWSNMALPALGTAPALRFLLILINRAVPRRRKMSNQTDVNAAFSGDERLLGFDVGGTKCAVVLGNARGEILQRTEWPSRAERGPEAMVADFVREAKQLGTAAIAAGVSIGGPLDSVRGIIYSPPNLPGWNAFPLKAELERQLSLPVSVEHDAAACAYAEFLWGSGQKAENLAYLTCGTGFGAGFVLGGRLHRGAGGRSCEVGHVGLRPDGPVAFGKRGSAEAYASGTGLSLLAAWKFPARWGTSAPRGAELARLAATGDAEAQQILSLNAEAVGEVAALLTDTLGLDLVLLGSLAGYLGENWFAAVRESFCARVLPFLGENCVIAAAGLGRRLQDCSALAAARGSVA